MPSCELCQVPTKRRTRNVDGLLCCTKCVMETTNLYEPKEQPKPKTSPKPQNSLSNALKSKRSTKPKHAVVRAYAGTGKTFSLIMGVAWAYAPNRWEEIVEGLAEQKGADSDSFKVTPSEEQQKIWDHFASVPRVKSIVYCAFNKSIVEEFNEDWGWLVEILKEEGVTLEFRTVNSLGNKAIYSAYGRCSVSGSRVEGLIANYLNRDLWELRRERPNLLKATQKLVDLCKLNLTGFEDGSFCADTISEQELSTLAGHYDIETNGDTETVYDLVPKILSECLKVEKYKDIDYNDQNWLPVVHRLPIPKVDLVLVDEAQDLPRCKQEFVMKLGRNIVCVGDVNQAIYGFAGADVDSIPRMEKMLGVDESFTLSETRRCSKAVVAEAQRLVPDFKAHESNSTGSVGNSKLSSGNGSNKSLSDESTYRSYISDGDMVLCRVNGPMVSEALRFIKNGRKAIIRGRQFGQSLIKFVEKLKARDLSDLIEKLDDWYASEVAKENRKKFPSEAKLMNLEDRKDCILSFTEDARDLQDVIDRINLVFAGRQCPNCKKHFNEETERCPIKSCKIEPDPSGGKWKVGPKLVRPEGIQFSSIHRAKGLEAKRVFLIQGTQAPIPHPMAKTQWARGQEMNLLYVAITRAIEELVYVS